MDRSLGLLSLSTSVLLPVFVLFYGVHSVEIHDLKVPAVVENGSRSSVILDCDYNYNEQDKPGLVVTWYFRNQLSPVYQWIPNAPQKPQGLGILKERLNLDYKVSDDEYKMHRALQIMNPTIELSGAYKCKVSSFIDEDHMSKTMTIYAPAKFVNITHVKPTTDSVNVTCRAEGVYPEPKFDLYRNPNHRSSVEIDGVDIAITASTSQEGAYDVAIHKLFKDRDLQAETVFECVLSIPETDYQVREKIIYYPGYPTNTGKGTRCYTTTVHLLLFQAILLFSTL